MLLGSLNITGYTNNDLLGQFLFTYEVMELSFGAILATAIKFLNC